MQFESIKTQIRHVKQKKSPTHFYWTVPYRGKQVNNIALNSYKFQNSSSETIHKINGKKMFLFCETDTRRMETEKGKRFYVSSFSFGILL